MRILLIGPGAVGTYFLGRLASRGDVAVDVIARSDAAYAAEHGYEIRSEIGNCTLRPESVVSDPALYHGNPDYVFVCTKTTSPAVDAVRMAAGRSDSPLVLIQNGIDVERPYLDAFPCREIYSAVAYCSCSRSERCVTLHSGRSRLELGMFPSGTPTTRLKALVDAIAASGVECELAADIQVNRWMKLLWNISYNVVSVIGGAVTTHHMLRGSRLGVVCRSIMEELVVLANANGVPLDSSHVERQIDLNDCITDSSTSMLQDYKAHRPMEVDGIVGNTLRIAERLGVDTPCIRMAYGLLSALNDANLKK
ncbi:MAG: ketopantoate reductase family protein [Victivallaceae bacterium]|nr:ketopantoate reductase family protein [Victivallaceae bacterium]